MSENKKGLLEQIRVAESEEEIKELLKQGEQYKDAHEATVRRWHRASKRRMQELARTK